MNSLMKLLLVVALASTSAGGEQQAASEFVNLEPDDVRFEPTPGNPGASLARLLGDPSAEGYYVIRYRVPAGQLVRPHYHDQDRHITVMSGTWAFGTGDSYDCADTEPMPPGSYVFHPKGAVHFDGSCSEEPIEVQIIGMGPVNTFWQDSD